MAECCEGGTRLIYSCAGSADVGEIADRVTQATMKDARMTCLAESAPVSSYVQSAKGADFNITVDGCQTACAKTLEK